MAPATTALLLTFALGALPPWGFAEPPAAVPDPDAVAVPDPDAVPDGSAPPDDAREVPEPESPDDPDPPSSAEPVGEGAEPVGEGAEPVGEGAEPVDEGAEPVDEGAEPVDEGAEPVDEGAEPNDDPFGDEADAEPWPDEPSPELEPETDQGPLPDYDPRFDSPQALAARHWVRTGIGTAAAGGALLVGAIIMGASDPCTRAAGNSCQVDARNRAALVMGIPAAVLIGGGATMIGVGLGRQRALTVDVQASRHGLGVGVRGRF